MSGRIMWLRPYRRLDYQDGRMPDAIVCFEKRAWWREVVADKDIVTQWYYRLTIDAWIAKMQFSWYGRRRSPETLAVQPTPDIKENQ